MTTAYLKAMSELEKKIVENKNLKDLLEEVYEMSFIDDMISDLRSGDDDVQLTHLLILKQDIQRVLNLSMTKKTASEIEEATGVKVLRANGESRNFILDKHYNKN
jgi:hypothetical protein